jgi:hypothetical protein
MMVSLSRLMISYMSKNDQISMSINVEKQKPTSMFLLIRAMSVDLSKLGVKD